MRSLSSLLTKEAGMKPLDFFVTLWPSFPHFNRFAGDTRLAGIRLNSAMINLTELREELAILPASPTVPLYFDIKGRQLRVTEVHESSECLDISLNHPVSVDTPSIVLFKAGADRALLAEVKDHGYRLVFHGGPQYIVRAGESLHIRDKSLQVGGEQFTDIEKEKIEQVKAAGFTRYFLSYVERQRDVDEFVELVGRDSLVMLKIENRAGLDYVAGEFQKRDGLRLVAAQGDLYVEIDRPHQILRAVKSIIDHDPEACVGSRLMLSTVQDPVPSCADFEQIAWLYEIGYRSMMLCDELCLKADLLATGLNALEAFKNDYATQTKDGPD